MKQLLLQVAAGPLLMAVVCLCGMPLGYYAGVVPACIGLVVLAIALGVLIRKLTDGMTAGLAVVLGVLPGIAAALGYHNLHELDVGEFVRGVAFAELPTLVTKDRLTLLDAVAHEELGEIATERVVVNNTPSERHTIDVSCHAYPISAKAWTRAEPVAVWRFGDLSHSQFAELSEAVLHPGQPNELCQRAIARASAKHQLSTAAGAIYLEAYVNDSPDEGSNRLQGPFMVAFLGSLWIGVVLYLGVRSALRRRT